MKYFDVLNGTGRPNNTNEYRHYKCIVTSIETTCNKVSNATNETINIPPHIPVIFDKLFIRYTLKTIFPITIRC